jgi:hypothetical protein
MTLLFLALALFYGLLTLITAVLKDKPATQERPVAGQRIESAEETARLRAAAIAIALARAEDEAGVIPSSPETDDQFISAWWALHHHRAVTLKPKRRRA